MIINKLVEKINSTLTYRTRRQLRKRLSLFRFWRQALQRLLCTLDAYTEMSPQWQILVRIARKMGFFAGVVRDAYKKQAWFAFHLYAAPVYEVKKEERIQSSEDP